MKKLFSNLPFRLLLGIVIGILVGLYAGKDFMQVVVTIKYVLGQIITFSVPLIIIGFIAPSITRLGNNASKILGIAVVIAYLSSIGAAFFSTAAGYGLIPNLHSADYACDERFGIIGVLRSCCIVDKVNQSSQST